MTIYEHRASVTTAAGTTNSKTLKVTGGLLRAVVIRANTATTVFRADLVDENSVTRQNWAFHTGELVDNTLTVPVSGELTLNITNASPNDTFAIYVGVQE